MQCLVFCMNSYHCNSDCKCFKRNVYYQFRPFTLRRFKSRVFNCMVFKSPVHVYGFQLYSSTVLFNCTLQLYSSTVPFKSTAFNCTIFEPLLQVSTSRFCFSSFLSSWYPSPRVKVRLQTKFRVRLTHRLVIYRQGIYFPSVQR